MSESKPPTTPDEPETAEQPVAAMASLSLQEPLNPVVAALPEDQQQRLAAMRSLEAQVVALETQMMQEKREIELKYHALMDPFAADRRKILVDDAPEEGKLSIPGFWGRAIQNSRSISKALIHSEKDSIALSYLSDVRCVLLTDAPGGFRLEFEFLPNPFFTNSVLTKSYQYCESNCSHEAEEVDGDLTEGCSIDWQVGKNLTVKVKKKKRSGRGNMAPITKTEPCETFFNFFNPPTLDDDMFEDLDDDEIEQLEDRMQEDMEMGELFRYTVIPHAVKYFVGDNSSDEESDSESDSDESDPEPTEPAQPMAEHTDAPNPHAPPPSGFDKGGGQEEAQPECKQQ
eukprot:TRINITY_DN10200_c0_g1_i2.p1 TRINITY_DN10200_c0_g1~~TRINITY_DN10200_c0_g1_i2.p1  ORF type:complete len:343 (+),score=106.65 TRINITY_DN10200_c0_g1_i2:204-1232(+)